MIVVLTWPELRRAAHVGIDRFVRARALGRAPAYGVGEDEWAAHVLGAWGECAVAKAIDGYWPRDNLRPDGGAADVGQLHVRTVDDPAKRLILHPADADDAPFVLVALEHLPRFQIVGWCPGADGKHDDHWWTGTGRPAFFVPRHALRPFADLIATTRSTTP